MRRPHLITDDRVRRTTNVTSADFRSDDVSSRHHVDEHSFPVWSFETERPIVSVSGHGPEQITSDADVWAKNVFADKYLHVQVVSRRRDTRAARASADFVNTT